MRRYIYSSDLGLQMQSSGEEEGEEFMGLDRDDAQTSIPRELIRNLNITRGGWVRGVRVCHGFHNNTHLLT